MSTEQKQPVNWGYWLVVVVTILLMANLARGVWGLWRVRGRVEEARKKVEVLRQEKEALEDDLRYQLSEEYTEREIRDKLNLALPGEMVLIMPEVTPVASVSAIIPRPTAPMTNVPIWKRWIEVFVNQK